jgi:hypothetical protein
MDTTALAFALIALVVLIRLEGRVYQLEQRAARLGISPRPPGASLESWLLRGVTALGFAWYLFSTAMSIRESLLPG